MGVSAAARTVAVQDGHGDSFGRLRQIAGRLTKLMRPERPEDVVEMAKLSSD